MILQFITRLQAVLFHEILTELNNKQDLLAPGNHTLFSVLISSFNFIEIWGDHITYMLEDWSFITIGTMMIWAILYLNIYRSTVIFKT